MQTNLSASPDPDPLARYAPPPAPPAMPWSTALALGAGITLVGSVLVLAVCAVGQMLTGRMMGLSGQMMSDMDILGAISVLGDYMTVMYYGDAERAHTYLSEQARKEISVSDLQAALDDPDSRYADYWTFEMTHTQGLQTSNPTARTFEEAMEGVRMLIQGWVYYGDGSERSFEAVVTREEDAWKIERLDFDVPDIPQPGYDP